MAMAIWSDRAQSATFERGPRNPSPQPRLVRIPGRGKPPDLEARAFTTISETPVNWDAVRRQTARAPQTGEGC